MAGSHLFAVIARSGGGRLLNAAIDKLLPVDAAKLPSKKKTLLGGIAGIAVLRIATRSVPGAIVVGGAMLAKRLYDKRHSKDAGKTGPMA